MYEEIFDFRWCHQVSNNPNLTQHSFAFDHMTARVKTHFSSALMKRVKQQLFGFFKIIHLKKSILISTQLFSLHSTILAFKVMKRMKKMITCFHLSNLVFHTRWELLFPPSWSAVVWSKILPLLYHIIWQHESQSDHNQVRVSSHLPLSPSVSLSLSLPQPPPLASASFSLSVLHPPTHLYSEIKKNRRIIGHLSGFKERG